MRRSGGNKRLNVGPRGEQGSLELLISAQGRSEQGRVLCSRPVARMGYAWWQVLSVHILQSYWRRLELLVFMRRRQLAACHFSCYQEQLVLGFGNFLLTLGIACPLTAYDFSGHRCVRNIVQFQVKHAEQKQTMKQNTNPQEWSR